MIEIVDLVVPGKPVPARREIKGRRGYGKLAWCEPFERWLERAVPVVEAEVWSHRSAYPVERGPLHLHVESVFPRPAKPVYKIGGQVVRYPWIWRDGRNPHLGKTDNDNLLKGPGDALVRGGLLHDDRWIVSTFGRKWYAAPGESAHVRITLWAYDPSEGIDPRTVTTTAQEALPWPE